jgi:hypothetical protein
MTPEIISSQLAHIICGIEKYMRKRMKKMNRRNEKYSQLKHNGIHQM